MDNDTNEENKNAQPGDQNQDTTNDAGIVHVSPQPSGHKKLIIIVAVVLILLGGAAAAWFMMQDKPAGNSGQSAKTTDTTDQKTQKQLQPFAVAYSQQTQEQKEGDCLSVQTNVYWRPIDGGDRTTAFDAGKQMYINASQTYQDKVFVVAEPGCDAKDGPTVWYSKDAGKTYTKLFSGKPTTETDWDQITSATFSSDGKSLLIALLAKDRKNTVKEISLDTKVVTDLFTVDNAGVFIKGYDTTKKHIYYFSGCYNCDGNKFEKLYVHDLAAKTDSVVFDDKDYIGVDMVINSDFTKLMRVKGVAGDLLGPSGPLTVEEFDITSKTFTKLQTITEEVQVRVGYREGDNLAYYTKGNSIYNAVNNAVLFESSQPILATYHVSKDQVVVATGVYNNFAVNNFTISTKKNINIFSGDDKTTVFGITWN